MTSSQKRSLFLKEDRTHTDNSLTTERGKTDESLSKFLNDSERQTDEKVKHGREKADEARAQRRTNTDLVRRTESIPNNKDVDQKAQNIRIKHRMFDDKTVKAERALMDAALVKERAQNRNAANELLHGEREETDENLLQERKRSDLQVDQVSDLLTTRNEFLAIVSHDLRNPLGAILSFTELLLEDSSTAEI